MTFTPTLLPNLQKFWITFLESTLYVRVLKYGCKQWGKSLIPWETWVLGVWYFNCLLYKHFHQNHQLQIGMETSKWIWPLKEELRSNFRVKRKKKENWANLSFSYINNMTIWFRLTQTVVQGQMFKFITCFQSWTMTTNVETPLLEKQF